MKEQHEEHGITVISHRTQGWSLGKTYHNPDSLSLKEVLSIWRQTGWLVIDKRAVWVQMFTNTPDGYLKFTDDSKEYHFKLKGKPIKGYKI